MATENSTFGTLNSDGHRRDGLYLQEARDKVKQDNAEGFLSEVVLLIEPHNFIDDTFKDDVVLMHSRLVEANTRIAGVQAIIDLHSKDFASVHDEVYDTHPICGHCNQNYPCDIRSSLEAAIRL